nr:MAG TPA: hypothetical protein [Caudoviricetes sp.]
MHFNANFIKPTFYQHKFHDRRTPHNEMSAFCVQRGD